jgi:molecular chaperone DnaK
MEASMKLGEAIYRAQAEASQGTEAKPEADDGVVDADFEEVRDEDRKRGA